MGVKHSQELRITSKPRMVEITQILHAFVHLLCILPLHRSRRTIAHSKRLGELYTTRVRDKSISDVKCEFTRVEHGNQEEHQDVLHAHGSGSVASHTRCPRALQRFRWSPRHLHPPRRSASSLAERISPQQAVDLDGLLVHHEQPAPWQ